MIEMITKSLGRLEDTLNETHANQRELADRVLNLEQKGGLSRAEKVDQNASIGAQVIAGLERNIDLLQKTQSLRLEVKAASDVITPSSGRNLVAGPVGSPTDGLVLGVQNGLRTVPAAGASAVEYFRLTGIEGAAGVQAGEGAAKPAVRPGHTAIVQSALTVAGWTSVSRQAMGDSAELRHAIDITLKRELGKALDVALMSGNVTPAFDGLLTLATAVTSATYTKLWDAASEAQANMAVAGYLADTVVLAPSDWLGMQVAVNATTGDYFSGSYLGPLPESLRGMKVVVSPTMTAGKVLVLDSQQIELRVVDQMTVEIGYVNDDFTRNKATVLGELRVIPIYRAATAARLVTPKAA